MWRRGARKGAAFCATAPPMRARARAAARRARARAPVTVNKSRRSTQAPAAVNTPAWDNRAGLAPLHWSLRGESNDGWGRLGGARIEKGAVKCDDFLRSDDSESTRQGRALQSRTKVGGSKRIRDPRSLNHKRCRLGMGGSPGLRWRRAPRGARRRPTTTLRTRGEI